MVNERQLKIIAEFVDRLKRTWVAAGPPSFVTLERTAKPLMGAPNPSALERVIPLPVATVHDLLQKERRRLPRWEIVCSLVVVLRRIVADKGQDPDIVIGTVDQWKSWHEHAAQAVEQAKHLARNVQTPSHSAPSVALAPERPPMPGPTSPETAIIDGQRRTLLAAAADQPAWWHHHRAEIPADEQPYLTLEWLSHKVQIYEAGLVPDLLHAEPYALEVAKRRHPEATPRQLARMVDYQMRRQRRLFKHNTTQVWVLLDEAALRPDEDRALWRAQLGYLAYLSTLPHVTLQVSSDEADDLLTGCGLRFLRFAQAAYPDIVYVRSRQGVTYPVKTAAVDRHIAFLHAQFLTAADPDTIVRLLHDLRDKWV